MPRKQPVPKRTGRASRADPIKERTRRNRADSDTTFDTGGHGTRYRRQLNDRPRGARTSGTRPQTRTFDDSYGPNPYGGRSRRSAQYDDPYEDRTPARRTRRSTAKAAQATGLFADKSPEERKELTDELVASGFGLVNSWLNPPSKVAAKQLAEENARAKIWLTRSPETRAAMDRDEDDEKYEEERRKDFEARDGDPDARKRLREADDAQDRVDAIKTRLLHEHPERFPAIIDQMRARGVDEPWMTISAAARGRQQQQQPPPPPIGGRPPGPGARRSRRSVAEDEEAEEAEEGSSNPTLGGTLLGGAAGAYVGERRRQGFLGAVGGALLGALGAEAINSRSARKGRDGSGMG